jgi:hypothetical protein
VEQLRVGSIPTVSTDLPVPCRISNILTPGQHSLKQACFYGRARRLEWRHFVHAGCAMDPRQRALDFRTATGLRVLEEVDGKPVPRYSDWIVHDLRRSAVKNLS